MSVQSVPAVVMASIMFYVSAYHLLVYLRRRRHRENLTFALTCLAMALYDGFSVGLYNVTSPAEGVHWQRAQVVAVALVSIAAPWFVVDYISRGTPISPRAKGWLTAFSIYFAVAAIVGIFDRSGLIQPGDGRPLVKEILLFWGGRVTYYEMELGPLVTLQNLMGLAVFAYVLWLAADVYRRERRKEIKPLLWALAAFFAAAVNDTAVAREFYAFVYVLEYAYLGMVLLMTYSLTTDIVEAAAVKEALQASEEKYRALFESSPESITLVGMDGIILDCNETTVAIAGLPKEKIVGRQFTDWDDLKAEEIPQYLNLLMRAMGGEELFPSELELDRPGHKTRWLEVFPALLEKDGQVYAIQVITREITERKQAEAEVLRLQHLLQNITDSMPSALITLDQGGHVLSCNPAAATLLGKIAAQVQGQLLWQACPELARYRDLFERVINEGEVLHRHREMLTADTGTTYRDVDIFPLAADDIEGAVLRIDVVTQRVQLEEMMLQSAKMASVGRLAAGVAHEINNPLGAIMQSAQIIQMAFDVRHPHTRERLQACGVDPEGLDRYLQTRGLIDYLDGIRDTGARAAKIVSDLLSFSHKSPSNLTLNSLNPLMQQMLDLAATDYDLEKKYDFRDVEIVCELAPDLPEVVCDGQQVQQVVLTLVHNAVRSMAEKRKERPAYRPRLILRTARREGYVRLEVEDNGPGIPESVQARLFEPLFTTEDVGEEAGLGLWLCWAIVVERHKGRIWFEPVPGGGARFVIELPVILDYRG